MADSEIFKIGRDEGGADLVDKLDEVQYITKGLTPGDWIVNKYLFVTLFR